MVTHIIHIADLHIRTGDPERARIEEYRHVFDGFLNDVRRLVAENVSNAYITVIAGDIFHNKGRIESAGFKLFSQFLQTLSELTPVFFICGNHDFRQEDPKIPDMLESMLDPWAATDRIKYLRDTGHYEHDDIGFGVVSVKDTLKFGNTTGIREELPKYPAHEHFGNHIKHKIAMFHGSLGESHGYPLDWFKGYDMLLLGDIHKQQIGTSSFGMKWGYPGSLVQQDHGESIFGHGYLLWDLQHGTVESRHVVNEYGMITLRKRDCMEVYLGHREWRPLSDAAAMCGFPRCPVVRVFGATTHETEDTLRALGINARHIQPMSRLDDVDGEEASRDTAEKDIEQLSLLCSPTKWNAYIQSVAPHLTASSAWLETPETMNVPKPAEAADIPQQVSVKINERASKFVKSLHEYAEAVGANTQTSRNKVVIKNVSWDYTLCYGESNHFDFDKLKGSIALLNGKNATGKSSFLDMLCLGLFGEQTRSKIMSGKKMTAKLIHNKKPPNKKAMNIKVLFAVNDKIHEIIREFGVQADKTNISQFGVELYEIDQQERVLIRDGVSAVNTWMERNVGTLESMLQSNIITQLDNNNFFTLKQEDQKELMEKALHLEAVTSLGNLIHEARLGHSYVIGQIQAVVETTRKMHNAEEVQRPEDLEKQITHLEGKLATLQEEKDKHASMLNGNQSMCNTTIEECDQNIGKLRKRLEAIGAMDSENQHKWFQELGTKLHMMETLRQDLAALHDVVIDNEEECDMDVLESRCNELNERLRLHQNGRPRLPTYSKKAVDSIEQDYDAWCKQQDQIIFQHTIEDLEAFVGMLLRYPSTHHNSVEVEHPIQSFQEFQRIVATLDLVKANHHSLCEKQDAHRSEEQYRMWVKKYNKWLATFEPVANTSVKALEKTLKKLQKQQQEYELYIMLEEVKRELSDFVDIPFNDGCWACQQQPWRKHFHEKESKAKMLQQKLGSLTCAPKPVSDEMIRTIEDSIRMRREYDENLQQWMEEYEEWELWRKEFKLFKQKCKELEAEMNTLQTRVLEFCNRHTHFPSIITDYKVWRQQMGRLLACKPDIEAYEAWENMYTRLCDEKEMADRCKQKWELQEQLQHLEDKYEINQKKLEKYKQWEDDSRALQHWEQQKAFLLYQSVNQHIQQIEQLLKQLRMEYGHAQTAYERYVRVCSTLEAQTTYLQQLKDREAILSELERWFVGSGDDEGYKSWIYVTKVIPLLQKELNRSLRSIDTIRMKIEYDKGSFVYMVEDGDRKPSLDKASGYQNFIISLCMRITLGRIGASHHNIRQLIIDEGFTSCDVDNLGKMPTFLKALISNGDYDSILLMSHLEGIRESTTAKIDIQQNGPFSRITWGDPYPTFITRQMHQDPSKVMKRGRPRKATASIM